MGFHEEDERFIVLLFKLSTAERLNKKESDEFNNIWWGLDRINIREFKFKPYSKMIPQILKDLAEKGTAPHPSLEDGNVDRSELYEDARSLELLDLYFFMKEYYRLVPAYVKHGVEIPDKVKKLFWESRICFLAGLYNSSVAISRAIVEMTIQKVLGKEGTRDSLFELIEEAFKNKKITEKAYKIADNIRKEGNNILHRTNLASKSEAEKIIDETKKFIEEAY